MPVAQVYTVQYSAVYYIFESYLYNRSTSQMGSFEKSCLSFKKKSCGLAFFSDNY
jgi:hypothetical protein